MGMTAYTKLADPNDNAIRAVNFATSKNLVVKSTTTHITKFINTLELTLMEKHTIILITS
jgi:hypothetical protein